MAQTIESISRVPSLRVPHQSTNDDKAAKAKNPQRKACENAYGPIYVGNLIRTTSRTGQHLVSVRRIRDRRAVSDNRPHAGDPQKHAWELPGRFHHAGARWTPCPRSPR